METLRGGERYPKECSEMMNNWIQNVRIERKEYINRFMMYPSINKMVKPIWSENVMISARKVYEGSMISRIGHQSLKKW